MVRIDSFNEDIKRDFACGHCPLIHNSSIAGVIVERLDVLIVFFDECVVRRRRFDAVELALPIAVCTAGTVDEALVD